MRVKFAVMIFIQFTFVKAIDEAANKAMQTGKNQFELIQRNAKMPRFGDCWKESLQHLENGCKKLTDDLQSRMALHFANCFLAQSGQKIYPCEDNVPISTCLSTIDSNGFTAYSEFFTVSTELFIHVRSMYIHIFSLFSAYSQHVSVFTKPNMA